MIKFAAACLFVLMEVTPAWAQFDRVLRDLGEMSG